MIELIVSERCTDCSKCAEVCPNLVLDAVSGETPDIARRDDCHTCFLCELYCASDAIYVSPLRTREHVSEAEIAASGFLGTYARANGWKNGRPAPETRAVALSQSGD